MKIWWIVNNYKYHVRYYGYYPEKEIEILVNCGQKDCTKFSVYELNIIATPEMIVLLLNEEFRHCMMPNYQNATLVYKYG